MDVDPQKGREVDERGLFCSMIYLLKNGDVPYLLWMEEILHHLGWLNPYR